MEIPAAFQAGDSVEGSPLGFSDVCGWLSRKEDFANRCRLVMGCDRTQDVVSVIDNAVNKHTKAIYKDS